MKQSVLASSYDKHVASDAKWERYAPGWYKAVLDGVLLEVRYYGKGREGAIRINKGKWHKQFSCFTCAGLKRKAVEWAFWCMEEGVMKQSVLANSYDKKEKGATTND